MISNESIEMHSRRKSVFAMSSPPSRRHARENSSRFLGAVVAAVNATVRVKANALVVELSGALDREVQNLLKCDDVGPDCKSFTQEEPETGLRLAPSTS